MASIARWPTDATLRALGLAPEWVQRAEIIEDGLSGAHLTRLWLSVPAGAWPAAPRWHSSRVVKELTAEGGWIGAATHDTRIREVALWQTNLAARLPRQIGLATERVTPPTSPDHPTAAALLMRDERAHLMPDPYRTPAGHLPPSIRRTLDALAALHARFWQSPELDDPRLGLTPLRETMLWLGPAAIEERLRIGDPTPYLRLAQRGWQAFFELIDPADAATLRAILDDPTPALTAIAQLPHTLIHGDVWGPNLGFLPASRRAPRLGARILLIDWALVAAAPATWDPLAMCGAWHTLPPVTLLAAYRARLERRLAARGVTLSPDIWRDLVAAGYLRSALSTGEAYARAVEEAPSASQRRRALRRLQWWAHRGAISARTLLNAPI